MKRAVILHVKQAEILAQAGERVDDVISFCPTASYFLREKKYHVTSTIEAYDVSAHAKVVRLIAAELASLREAAQTQYQLSNVEAEALSVYLYHFLCCAYHLHFCLTSYRHHNQFIWVDGRKIMRGDYEAMFASLARQPSSAILAYSYTNYSLPHALVAMMYNRITGFFIMRSRRLKVIDYGDELPKRLAAAMIEQGANPVIINTHAVAKNLYKTKRFFLKSLVRLMRAKPDGKPVYLFRVARPSAYRVRVADFVMPATHAKEVGLSVKEMVERFIPFARTEVAMGRELIRLSQPQVAISDHAKYAYILSGLEEMSDYGGQHAMINHGTHTIQYDDVSAQAALLWAKQQRIISQHTTHSLPKSPLTEALARQIRPFADYRSIKLNVYGKINHQPAMDGKFVVLQAGNYTDAMNHIPWCKETADEYLMAIIELIEEVARLENVELIIKLKNKKADTHKKIVEAHIAKIGAGDKVRVDTTSKFSDLMARAHLIVCNLSGTIEEALANNIPMMIHTYRKTYFHIAEETVRQSTTGEVAPAYLVKKREDIAGIITRLSSLRAKLNDPALYRNVAWPEEERVSMQQFAAMLIRDATL